VNEDKEFLIWLTEEEIEASIELDYSGGEYLASTWDEDSFAELMDPVDKAIEKMREAMKRD
jgi:hypothetical protein